MFFIFRLQNTHVQFCQLWDKREKIWCFVYCFTSQAPTPNWYAINGIMACYFRESSIQWYVIHNWLTTISEELNVLAFNITDQCLLSLIEMEIGPLLNTKIYFFLYFTSRQGMFVSDVYDTQWNTCVALLRPLQFVNIQQSHQNSLWYTMEHMWDLTDIVSIC